MKMINIKYFIVLATLLFVTRSRAEESRYEEFKKDMQKTGSEIFRRRSLSTPDRPERVDIYFLTVVQNHFIKLVGEKPENPISADKVPYVVLFAAYYCRIEGNCMVASAMSRFKRGHPEEFRREIEALKARFPDGVDSLLEGIRDFESGAPQG